MEGNLGYNSFSPKESLVSLPTHDIGSPFSDHREEPGARLVLAFPGISLADSLDTQDPPSSIGTMRGLGYAIVLELIAATVIVFGWMLWRHFR